MKNEIFESWKGWNLEDSTYKVRRSSESINKEAAINLSEKKNLFLSEHINNVSMISDHLLRIIGLEDWREERRKVYEKEVDELKIEIKRDFIKFCLNCEMYRKIMKMEKCKELESAKWRACDDDLDFGRVIFKQ